MIESSAMLTKQEESDVLRRRRSFSTPDGIKTLAEIVVSAGVFEKLDPEDREAAAVRNFAIDLLDSMCMVQDGSLEMLLANMLATPLPKAKMEEVGDYPILI